MSEGKEEERERRAEEVSIESKHETDDDGNPAGGSTYATGVRIIWQNGPLGRGPDRKEPNGAFVEDVIRAAINRLEFYESSKFRCDENEKALQHLRAALAALEARTADREAMGVEGTHIV